MNLKNSIGITVSRYENKEKYLIYVSKKYCEEKHVDLLLVKEGEKNVLIKDFNRFMNGHSLHHGENIFVIVVYILSLHKKY